MPSIRDNPFTRLSQALKNLGSAQSPPAKVPPGTQYGPQPKPPPPTPQDLFERVVNSDAMHRLEGVAKFIDVATKGPFAQREPRGGVTPLVDASGVADLQAGQVDKQKGGPVTRLQEFLVRAGYLDMTDTAYGTFGPRTQKALANFQAAEGIGPKQDVATAVDGKKPGFIGPATLAAMQAPQHPKPDSTVDLLVKAYGAQLGRPMSPLEAGPNGARVQQFEKGSITRMPGGEVRVQDLSGKDLVAPIPPSTVSSVDEARAFHVAQWGKTGATEFNDGSKYYGGNDCGPTSIIMAATAVGAMEHPDAAHAGVTIDSVRDSILGPSNESVTMTVDQLAKGLDKAGADATIVRKTHVSAETVDAALARGHPVILGGNPFGYDADHQAWGPTASAADNYLMDHNFGNHWVSIAGKTPEGNYVVNDPLCPRGPIEVTPEELAEFIDGNIGMIEVSARPPPLS
ncbi:peptidoglycan-binding protein [Myxococcaceae bacterium JPH2]|nr:peptidoglycan-binding protein [Myxococcaceae bacterium JPH2]